MTSTLVEPDAASADAAAQQPSRLRASLIVMIAIAALVIAAGGGWLVRGSGDSAAAAGPNAVDVGFAQDMITHHIQAVTMAGVERDGTSSAALHSLAFDMETAQQFQVGQMSGWLDAWNKGRNDPDQMAWMGHEHMAMGADGLMPGMATADQMTALTDATGKAQDILFLQLMIRHHQGGIPMAQYALTHASEPYVRDLAQAMINSQSTEIIEMEQQLRALGGSPLAPPT